MTDELNITIRIADLPATSLTIARADEEHVRSAAATVNRLYGLLRTRYPDKASAELLGLAALQLARKAAVGETGLAEAETALAEASAALDEALDASWAILHTAE